MKSVFKIISSFLIIFLMPFSFITGQDKKSEQKIKIIVTDDSGTKVMIDTLIKGGSIGDSIRLSNGKIILIGHSEDVSVVKHGSGNEKMTVIVTTDGKEPKKDYKTFTIVSSDSVTWTEKAEGGKVIVMSSDKDTPVKGEYHYIIKSGDSKDKGKQVEKIVYINEGKSVDKEVDKTFDIYVSDNDKDSSSEKTRYVIAKDGIVVSVEGNDEAKVKDLIKEIENKMGVKPEDSDKKETVTVETKKTVKK
jgi:hypothetical protein